MFTSFCKYLRRYSMAERLSSTNGKEELNKAAEVVESGSIDAFSSLPDEILAYILSFLPTKRAASTSILSTRWRNLFTLMIRFFASKHHLRFYDTDLLYPKETKLRQDHARESFRSLIDTTLSIRQRQVGGNCNKSLKKFSLICEDDRDHFKAHTKRWISNVLKRGISDLHLCITMPINLLCLIPSTVFTCKTLVKLTLGTGLCIDDIHIGEVCLPMLKSLFLYTVWFLDRDISDFVVRGCPVLEELYIHHNLIHGNYSHPNYIHRDNFHSAGPYDFYHPTIKRITIHRSVTGSSTYGICRLAFNTPNLVYLDYSDRFVSFDYYSANFLDSLLEARFNLLSPRDLSLVEPQRHSKFISWICNVQILDLSSNTVELMLECLDHWESNGGFPLFKNLVKLSFECRTKMGWKVLWSLIKNSPKLETLILKGFICIRRSCEVSIDGNAVKVLEICGFNGTGRELIQLKRFLWELEFLQLVKVQVDAKKIDDNKKLQLTNDVLALPKRSSNCQIQFL